MREPSLTVGLLTPVLISFEDVTTYFGKMSIGAVGNFCRIFSTSLRLG
jgi:hypothetical protein